MFNRIMLATDFSPACDAAARATLSLATAYGADVLLLHVVSFVYYDVAYANIPHAEDEARRSAEKQLAALADSMETSYVRARTVVRCGKPGETIVDCAREEGVELIIVGAHGRHGLSRMLVGSVAERVARLAPCHVLTVKAEP
jgi:nucleotide-binding universal stress UspA family protein